MNRDICNRLLSFLKKKEKIMDVSWVFSLDISDSGKTGGGNTRIVGSTFATLFICPVMQCYLMTCFVISGSIAGSGYEQGRKHSHNLSMVSLSL